MKKYIFFTILSFTFLLGLAAYQFFSFNDGRLHVVFCDVGQGDAIFIRVPNQKLILVDAGHDKSVVDCLSKHMSFWERKIDLVFLTHPHQDHFFGLNYVLERYSVLSFVTERLSNESASFRDFIRKIKDEGISQKTVFAGDKYRIGEAALSIESPSQEFLARSSPNGMIGERAEFASLIMTITYKDFDLMLTGDSQIEALLEAISKNKKIIEVLQVPHHGSKSGLNREVLERLLPRLAIISVGAKNRYGHPNKQIINMLDEAKIKILRTDQRGDIEIVSDGTTWRIQ